MADDPSYHISQDIEQRKTQSEQKDGCMDHWRVAVRNAAQNEITQSWDGENLFNHNRARQVKRQHLEEARDN